MKQILFVAMAATCFSIFSCSKKTTSDQQPQTKNTVTIGGTEYTTVKVGSQTWTAVNYNGVGGQNYNNSNTNNATYGKLYTLAEAKAISLPTGWRLPNKTDVEKLLVYAGAKGTSNIGVDGDATVSIKLKSKSDWLFTQGNNSTGFNAYPAGNNFGGKGEGTAFWSNSVDPGNDQYTLNISNVQDGPNVNDSAGLDYIATTAVTTSRLSLRFVKDN